MNSEDNNKLRAILLASLMFFWLFAGTVAFAGSAAAASANLEADLVDGTSTTDDFEFEYTVDETFENVDTIIIEVDDAGNGDLNFDGTTGSPDDIVTSTIDGETLELDALEAFESDAGTVTRIELQLSEEIEINSEETVTISSDANVIEINSGEVDTADLGVTFGLKGEADLAEPYPSSSAIDSVEYDTTTGSIAGDISFESAEITSDEEPIEVTVTATSIDGEHTAETVVNVDADDESPTQFTIDDLQATESYDLTFEVTAVGGDSEGTDRFAISADGDPTEIAVTADDTTDTADTDATITAAPAVADALVANDRPDAVVVTFDSAIELDGETPDANSVFTFAPDEELEEDRNVGEAELGVEDGAAIVPLDGPISADDPETLTDALDYGSDVNALVSDGVPAASFASQNVQNNVDDPIQAGLTIDVDPGEADVENNFEYVADVSTVDDDTDIENIRITLGEGVPDDTVETIEEDDVSIQGDGISTSGIDVVEQIERTDAPDELLITTSDTFTLADVSGDLTVSIDRVTVPNEGQSTGEIQFEGNGVGIASAQDSYEITEAASDDGDLVESIPVGDASDVELNVVAQTYGPGPAVLSDELVDIVVGAIDGDGVTPVEGVDVTVELIRPADEEEGDDEGTTIAEDVETNSDGNVHVQVDPADFDDGIYQVSLATESEDVESFASTEIRIGPEEIITTRTSSGTFVNSEAEIAIRYMDNREPIAGEIGPVEILDPEGEVVLTETLETDESGFTTLNFTPEQQGTYRINQPEDDVIAINDRIEVTEFVAEVRPGTVEAGQPATIPGHIFGSDGPYSQEDIQIRIYDEQPNDPDSTEIDTVETTTNGAGLFTADFEAPEEAGTYYYELISLPETTIPLDTFEKRFDVESVDETDETQGNDESTTRPTIDAEISTSGTDRRLAPGETATIEIDAEDGAGDPLVEEPVQVTFRYDFNGPLANSTVAETNASGQTAVTFEVPDSAPLGSELEATTRIKPEDEVISDSTFSAPIQTHFVRLNDSIQITPGDETEIPVTVTDVDGDPVADSTYAFDAQPNQLQRSISTGSTTTDADGEGAFSVSTPIRTESVEIVAGGLYELDGRFISSFSSSTTSRRSSNGQLQSLQSQGVSGVRLDVAHPSAELAIGQDALVPGESVSATFENDDAESGIVLLSSFDDPAAQAEIVEPGETASFSIPESAADGNFYEFNVLAFGDDQSRYTDRKVFRIDSEATDSGPQVSFGASSPASQTISAGFSISIDQEVEVADLEIRDDVDEVVFEQDVTGALEDGEGIEWDTTDQAGDVVDDGSYDAVLTVEDEVGNEVIETDTIEVDNTPPQVEITNIDTNALAAGEEVEITAEVTSENTDVVAAQVGLLAEFTSYDATEAFSSDGTLTATIGADEVADDVGDGDFVAAAAAVDEGGNIGEVPDGQQVTIDTSPPEIRASVSDLAEDTATLTVESDEDGTITGLDITADGDGTDDRTPEPSAYDGAEIGPDNSVEIEFDGGTVGGEDTTFTIDIDAEDDVGNEASDTITSSITGYEIDEENENATVNPDAVASQFDLDVNTDEVDEGDTERDASISQTDSIPAGTDLEGDQVAGQFIDVADIGLNDDELEQATVRIPLDDIDVEDFEDDELSIFFAEGDSSDYEELDAEIEEIEGEEFLTTQVNGFSQLAPGGVDDEPPEIGEPSVDPESPIDPSNNDEVEVTFDYTPVISDIDTAATSVDVGVDADRTSVQITNSQATVTVDSLEAGEEFDVTLTVADEANNEAQETVEIEVEAEETEQEEEESGTTTSIGSSASSGTSTDSDTTGQTVSITDEVPTDPGTTVTFSQTALSAITFETDGIEGTVSVDELDSVPSERPAFEANRPVAAVFEIDVPEEATDESATLEFELTTDDLDDVGLEPNEAAVLRGLDDEYQELDTDVEIDGDTVTIVAETPGFSTFVISDSEAESESEPEAETPDSEDETPEPDEETPEPIEETPDSEEETPEPDDQTGFGVGVALAALLAVALLAYRQD